jgi:ribA/ribD-fused uncharacterized protein
MKIHWWDLNEEEEEHFRNIGRKAKQQKGRNKMTKRIIVTPEPQMPKAKPISKFRKKYFFLSNFYPCEIRASGKVYASAEHAYHACKTLNEEEREKVRLAPTPAKAKSLGRKVTMQEGWDKGKKVIVMKAIQVYKYTKNEFLKKQLLATGDTDLIEGNIHCDNFWGDCWCPDCRDIKGENMLGELLMQVRDEIRAEESVPDLSEMVAE